MADIDDAAAVGRKRWEGVSGEGKGGYGRLALSKNGIVEGETNGQAMKFVFIDETSSLRLRRPAVFPILAAFRLLVEEDPQGEEHGKYRAVRWRDGFDDVKSLWTSAGSKLLRIVYDHWDSSGKDAHAAGRAPSLWNALYTELTVSDFEREKAGAPVAG